MPAEVNDRQTAQRGPSGSLHGSSLWACRRAAAFANYEVDKLPVARAHNLLP